MKKANVRPPQVEPGIHLNIGCGARVWDGFTNIDFPGNWSGRKPDIEADIRSIPLPDDHADSAYAIHVLEHFYRYETDDVLKEWIRVLKPGGKLVIEVPCLDRVIHHFNLAMKNKEPINYQRTMWRLYGDPIYKVPEMVHRWCFSTNELIAVMRDLGLRDVRAMEPEFHHPQCDMRVVGYK